MKLQAEEYQESQDTGSMEGSFPRNLNGASPCPAHTSVSDF